jgi:hypothetical protein
MPAPKIAQIAPCNGWIFRHRGVDNRDVNHPVAAWALLDNGDVIGLIPASDATTANNEARLVAPPPVGGTYH